MDTSIVELIAQLIGSVGFPMYCCITLFNKSENDSKRNAEKDEKMIESINNNTLALTELKTYIGGRHEN